MQTHKIFRGVKGYLTGQKFSSIHFLPDISDTNLHCDCIMPLRIAAKISFNTESASPANSQGKESSKYNHSHLALSGDPMQELCVTATAPEKTRLTLYNPA